MKLIVAMLPPVLLIVGCSCVIRGAWMIYPPAAFLVAGTLLIALAVGLVTTK